MSYLIFSRIRTTVNCIDTGSNVSSLEFMSAILSHLIESDIMSNS